MSEEQIILNKTDKANSWETGATGNRWKFYFNDVIDLLEQIKKLKEAGFDSFKLKWIAPSKFGKIGNFLFGNRVVSFFYNSHFIIFAKKC